MAKVIPIFVVMMTISIGHSASAQTLPRNEQEIIQHFQKKGLRLKLDDAGHVIQIFSSGKPEMTVAEYQLMGKLQHLEQIALNAPPMGDDDWGFLKEMKNLKRLTIWHGKGFSTLKQFSDLKIEALTVGGCMGLRDLNRENPEKQLNAVKSLTGLKSVTYLNLYHSPLLPTDEHLEHVAKEFPKLERFKFDVKAPRGKETTITPAGIESLQKLPLKEISIENGEGFTTKHFAAIAGINALETLLIDARRSKVPAEGIEAFKKLRPEVNVGIAKPGDERPPTIPKAKRESHQE